MKNKYNVELIDLIIEDFLKYNEQPDSIKSDFNINMNYSVDSNHCVLDLYFKFPKSINKDKFIEALNEINFVREMMEIENAKHLFEIFKTPYNMNAVFAFEDQMSFMIGKLHVEDRDYSFVNTIVGLGDIAKEMVYNAVIHKDFNPFYYPDGNTECEYSRVLETKNDLESVNLELYRQKKQSIAVCIYKDKDDDTACGYDWLPIPSKYEVTEFHKIYRFLLNKELEDKFILGYKVNYQDRTIYRALLDSSLNEVTVEKDWWSLRDDAIDNEECGSISLEDWKAAFSSELNDDGVIENLDTFKGVDRALIQSITDDILTEK